MPGFISRLFGLSSSPREGLGSEDRAWKGRLGPPGPIQQLNPLAGSLSSYEVKKRKRRREARENYQAKRRRLVKDRRKARGELKGKLRRQKQSIASYYERKAGVLGEERAEEKARKRFELRKKEAERGFDTSWRRREHELARARDERYREITKDLQREARRRRGMPAERQMPWNV